jgi:hypothetical protein
MDRQFPKTREVSVGEEANTNYREPECHIEPLNCVGTSGTQPVRGAAAASGGGVSTTISGGLNTWHTSFFCAGAGGILGMPAPR